MRRTSGKSTGEFIAAVKGVGRTELGKGRRSSKSEERWVEQEGMWKRLRGA